MANSKIEVYRGTSMPFVYNHLDPVTKLPIALTNCTLYFTVKANKYDTSSDDSTALIKKTVLPAGHTDAAGGISGFTLTDVDTYIEPGKYFFTVLVENGISSQPPSLIGTFEVLPQQTNRQTVNG